MKRRRLILFGALALIAAGVVALWPRGPKEPVYQGKKLSEWLADLDYSGNFADLASIKAVQHLGKDVLPHLEPMLHAQDSLLKLRVVKLLRKQSVIEVRFTPASQQRLQAAAACRALRDLATGYVPELTVMLNGTNSTEAWFGMAALLDVKGRSNCVPEMLMGLTNSYNRVRWFSAGVLGEVWGHAGSALPALVRCLNDPDPRVREYAIHTLANFKTEAALIVPAFIQCLDSPHAPTRTEAATYLTSFGTNAEPARDKLSELLKDSDSEVQRSARSALNTLNRLRKP